MSRTVPDMSQAMLNLRYGNHGKEEPEIAVRDELRIEQFCAWIWK